MHQPPSAPAKEKKPPVSRKRLMLITSIVAILVIGGGIAYWLLMPKPEEDALRSKQAFCQCDEQNIRAIIAEHRQFIKEFSTRGYKRRMEAWPAFDQLHNAGTDQYAACNAQAGELEAELRGRFQGNEEKLARFHQTFNQKNCEDSLSEFLPQLSSQAQELIVGLKEPLPDMGRVLSDLAVRQYRWWPFGTLVDHTSISDLVAEPNEYNPDNYILKTTIKREDQHQPYTEADLILTYDNDYRDGWKLRSITAPEVRQHIVAEVGKWNRVNPLSDDMGFNSSKRYWIKSGGYYSRGVKGGPDVGKITINRANYYEVASRELDPVTVVFTFRNPRN